MISKRAIHTRFRKPGSALIAVLIALLVLSLIGASLHAYTITDMKVCERHFVNRQLAIVCESGVDVAAADLRATGFFDGVAATELSTAMGPLGWSKVGADLIKNMPGQNVGDGAKAEIRLLVTGLNTDTPTAYAQATVTSGPSTGVSRQMAVFCGKSSAGNPLLGLIARKVLRSSGRLKSDSYDAGRGPYSAAARRDKTTVGTVSPTAADLLLGAFTDIFGRVGFGGDTSEITGVNDSAHVHTTESDSTYRHHGVDTSAAVGGLKLSFKTPPVPDASHAPVLSIGPDGAVRIDGEPVPDGVLPGGVYRVREELNINSATRMRIVGPVSLVVDASPWGPSFAPRIQVSGESVMEISDEGAEPGKMAQLKIFTPGGVNWSGEVIANSPPPSRLAIIGTAPETEHPVQQINLSGNTDFTGVIYTPNAVLNLSGNTTVYGAAVGATVNTSGNTTVHYDESLSGIVDSGRPAIIGVTELTGSERIPFPAK